MKSNLKSGFWKAVLLFSFLFVACANSAELKTKAQLISEYETIAPNQTFTVAIKFEIAEHWHTYWRNAGDAGFATQVSWQLPEGFKAGEIQWPAPKRLPVGQDILNFGYEKEVWHLVNITAPPELKLGKNYTLKAKIDWLECAEICVPGRANVELIVKSALTSEQSTEQAVAFQKAKAKLPQKNAPFSISARQQGSNLILKLTGSFNGEVTFFPFTESLIINSAPQKLIKKAGHAELSIPLAPEIVVPENFSGVLVINDAVDQNLTQSWEVTFPVEQVTLISQTAPSPKTNSLATSLILGFVGGLILNLMPCVFPVLGIKLMSLLHQTAQTPQQTRRHGWAYTAGVLLSFWLLAGVLLLIRSGGQELGWGFQLQSPIFVYGLLLVLFVFGLNMSGVFEVGSSLIGVGAKINHSSLSQLTSSFFSGVLAVVVATPCAAPFLAPALGAALTLPLLSSLALFTSIALGLAAPFLILCLQPAWLRFLPKPGAWMEHLKQFLAFLLYAAAAYLLWVLEGQVSEDELLALLFSLIMIALACWVYGRFTGLELKTSSRMKGWITTGLLIILGIYLGLPNLNTNKTTGLEIVWEPWSPELVETYRAEGRIIYVDFTARWCATCQTNKKAVFSSDEVLKTFKKKNVATLKADWTNKDDRITRELALYGRSAIPFNLVYFPNQPSPIILPELLLPSSVLNLFE